MSCHRHHPSSKTRKKKPPCLCKSSHTLTRNLGHPIIPSTAEELALGRQIRGPVQCAIEDVDEIAGIGLIKNHLETSPVSPKSSASAAVSFPFPHQTRNTEEEEEGRRRGNLPLDLWLRTPYSNKPLPHSRQNSRWRSVPAPLSASWALTLSSPSVTV